MPETRQGHKPHQQETTAKNLSTYQCGAVTLIGLIIGFPIGLFASGGPFALARFGALLDAHNGAVAALAGVAVAIFTLALVHSTDRLWEAGERQIRVARTTADAAKASAEATIASERAYVYVDTTLTQKANERQGVFNAVDQHREIVIGNFGRTPARIISVMGWVQYWRGANLDDLDPAHDPKDYGFWLAPGASSGPIPIKNGATQGEVERVRGGHDRGHIVIIGRIVYSDVFGRCHATGFCFVFDTKVLTVQTVNRSDLNYDKPIDCPEEVHASPPA